MQQRTCATESRSTKYQCPLAGARHWSTSPRSQTGPSVPSMSRFIVDVRSPTEKTWSPARAEDRGSGRVMGVRLSYRLLERLKRVPEQHGNGHAPHAAGHRRDRGGDLGNGAVGDVSDDPIALGLAGV